jgi:AraC-like DNA-binding protein
MFAKTASFEEPLRLEAGREGFLNRGGPGRHPMPRHRERELNLVLAGSARYLIESGGELRRVELSPGTLIWLYPTQDHVLIDKSDDYQAWVGVATDALLSSPFVDPRPDPLQGDARQLSPGALRRLDALFTEVNAISEPHAFNAGLAYSFALAWEAFRATDALLPERLHPAVARAVGLLRAHPEQDETVGQLARRCGLSAPLLTRYFREQTGLTLLAFRNRERVRRFEALLASPHSPTMLDAALQAGFGSYAQLHRAFVAVHGVGPRTRLQGTFPAPRL